MDNFTTPTSIPDLPVRATALLSRSAYNILAAYTGFLMIAGIFNNGLVIYLFIKYQNLRQPVNYFLLNLSCSDMTISLFATLLTFASNVAGRWLFGKIGCSIYAFLVMVAGFEQIVALAAISIHRCIMVVRPFTAKKMTTYWANLFVAMTWVYSFILSVPPAFGWNEYVPEGAGTACAINWTDGKPGYTSYVIFIFVMALVVPLIVIIVSYGLLIFAVKKIGESEAAQSTENKAEGRVTKMVVIMIVLFLFAWTPYSGFALYVALNNSASVSPLFGMLPPFFAKLCTIYNPIIYFALNRQFRDAFYDLIGHQPSDVLDSTGPRNNRGPATAAPTSSTDRQRSASQTTLMSELTSTHPSKASGATNRPKIPSRKPPPEPSGLLALPLPGQPSMEMNETPITAVITNEIIEAAQLNNLNVSEGGCDNSGYLGTDGDSEARNDQSVGVNVLTQRHKSTLPEVDV